MIGDMNAVAGEAVANVIRKEGGYVLWFFLFRRTDEIDQYVATALMVCYHPTLQGSGFHQV